MEIETFIRNQHINYIQIAKSYTQNITRHSIDRSQMLQKTRAEENHSAIENFELKIRQLEDENKNIEYILK